MAVVLVWGGEGCAATGMTAMGATVGAFRSSSPEKWADEIPKTHNDGGWPAAWRSPQGWPSVRVHKTRRSAWGERKAWVKLGQVCKAPSGRDRCPRAGGHGRPRRRCSRENPQPRKTVSVPTDSLKIRALTMRAVACGNWVMEKGRNWLPRNAVTHRQWLWLDSDEVRQAGNDMRAT